VAYPTNYQFTAINSVRALVAAVNRFVPLIFEWMLAAQLRQHILMPTAIKPATKVAYSTPTIACVSGTMGSPTTTPIIRKFREHIVKV